MAEHADGLLAAVLIDATAADGLRHLRQYASLFRDRCYLAVALHHGANDERRLEQCLALAGQARCPAVATNDVHYHEPGRRPLQDVLTAIRHGLTVAELGNRRFANGERHLKAPAEMHALFAGHPQALRMPSSWPSAAGSRSTNCATNTPRNSVRRV